MWFGLIASRSYCTASIMPREHGAHGRAARQLLLSLSVLVIQWLLLAGQPVNLSMRQVSPTLTATNFDSSCKRMIQCRTKRRPKSTLAASRQDRSSS